jgi:asparagine synthase (glutamine-hydrolysing)
LPTCSGLIDVDAIAGIVRLDGLPIERRISSHVRNALVSRDPGTIHIQSTSNAYFAHNSGARVSVPARAQSNADESSVFVATAHLDNRDEIGRLLGLGTAQRNDAQLVELVYRRFGDAGIAKLLGAFSFAHWDGRARRLILGRDCLGCAALFFHVGQNAVVFATRLTTLLALPDVPRKIDEVALANFMALNYADTAQTFYRGIERVPSRTMVTIGLDAVHRRHYWTPQISAASSILREQDYVDRARELLDQAVETAVHNAPRFAILTSGGLDSSAIAATAARLRLADRIECYTGVPPAGAAVKVGRNRYISEADKVNALARMHPSLDIRLVTPEGIHPFEADDTRFFARAALPIHGPANHGWFSHINDKISADGHRVVLHGLRGNHGLSWSGEFSLVALLRSGHWRDFARELAALSRASDRGILGTFRREFLRRIVPLSMARALYRLQRREPDSVQRFCALNVETMTELDLPRRWREQEFDAWHVTRGLDAAQWRAYHLFDYNQVGRDLYALWPDINGFEMRDPLADRRLLEFLLTVPEWLFRRNGVPRSFARQVLSDRLPPEIVNERKRGAQAVTWFRALDARKKDIAEDVKRIEASPLASRMLDVARLKQLMIEWPENEDAAFSRLRDYKLALGRGVHMGRFIRWVEGGNA